MHATPKKLQNPLTAAQDLDDRVRLIELFPDLAGCSESHFLALRSYLHKCPERFFSRNAHTLMLDWLKGRDSRQRIELRDYLANIEVEINAAILFLRQINSEAWHDEPLHQDVDYQALRIIDKILHPAYLRLAEGVLAPLIRPVAHFSRLDRRKGTEGLDIYRLMQELSQTPMAACVDTYDHVVRNAIAHGGITYLEREIQYHDKRGNVKLLDVKSVIRLCDDMVDTCNGLAAAIKVFLILSLNVGYKLPRELLVEELVEETRSPWWRIEGCAESELPGATQLLVYACPNSRDVLKIQWAAMQSAILAESLAPGYDRYFFPLRTSKTFAGWAAFDGTRLRKLRESGATQVHEYAPALENPGVFYLPRPALPRFLCSLDTLLQSFRLHWPLARLQFFKTRGIPNIVCRDARMHRNAWGYVLSGAIVITELRNETIAESIRSQKARIVRAAAKRARSSTSLLDLRRYLPLGFARVSVYVNDFRRHRFKSFGLGPELVCTIQLQRIRRIRSPDILGSSIETIGHWRIAWNRAWITSGGRITTGAIGTPPV